MNQAKPAGRVLARAFQNASFMFTIGVDPAFQGRGFTGALIKPILQRLDRERLPCYLDTHDPKNISLYEKYGFEVVEESKIPETNIHLYAYAMLRQNQIQPER